MSNKTGIPPIKSQGIKTALVPWIMSIVPESFSGTWIEPFCGTAVVGLNVPARKKILCDVNPHIIKFYKNLQNKRIDSCVIRSFLEEQGELLETIPDYYYKVRERFNDCHNSLDFLFLSRSCFNGLMRWNGKGKYNVPFCKNNKRFASRYIDKIIRQVEWVEVTLAEQDIEFHEQSFEVTIQNGKEGDMIYCDPPYMGLYADYYSSWGVEQEEKMCNLLSNSTSNFILSTWLKNKNGKNPNVEKWLEYEMFTSEHIYKVGGHSKRQSAVMEAVFTNFTKVYK